MRTVVAQNALPSYLQDILQNGGERAVCPRCDGGSSNEASLGIRRTEDGVISMHCFRASCGWHGLTLAGPDVIYDLKKIKTGRVYRDPTEPLRGCVRDSMIIDYGLDASLLDQRGWRLNTDLDTLVIPVKDRNGQELGHITRTVLLPEKRVYTYKATARPWLDVWMNEGVSPVVLVEDCLSAARLSQLGYGAVSLMGTSLSNEQAREIASIAGEREIVMALDRDAFDKSMKLAARHRHVMPTGRVLCLEEDIKNMAYDRDICRLITGDRRNG